MTVPTAREPAGFDRYLSSLLGSWRALAAPHEDARTWQTEAFVAARFPRHPVLNNAALLSEGAWPGVAGLYGRGEPYAIWSAGEPTDRVLEAAGLRHVTTTTPMLADLRTVAAAAPDAQVLVQVLADVDPAVVADLNGVDHGMLAGVPGLHAYATADGESGLVLVEVDSDVNVSFVQTRPEARGRGLASLVLRAALATVRDRGFSTATLQATPMAAGLYRRAGFRPLGRWHEWEPAA